MAQALATPLAASLSLICNTTTTRIPNSLSFPSPTPPKVNSFTFFSSSVV
ncbi:hypothetical protein CsSME_00034891 [Camellia sinensis var. sinensis]